LLLSLFSALAAALPPKYIGLPLHHACCSLCHLLLQEFFLPGSLFAVKSLHTVRGERRTINFYSAARLDGLVCREELVGKKLIDRFSGRDDRLEYRSATFGVSLSSSGAASGVGGGAGLAGDGFGGADGKPPQQLGLLGEAAAAGAASAAAAGAGQDRALPIMKMTEKFGRNPDKPADEDVAKRVFYLDQGKTMLFFQHGEGRLTAGYLVFHKDGQAQAVQVRLCSVLLDRSSQTAGPAIHQLKHGQQFLPVAAVLPTEHAPAILHRVCRPWQLTP
jgi:hypothetical protein